MIDIMAWAQKPLIKDNAPGAAKHPCYFTKDLSSLVVYCVLHTKLRAEIGTQQKEYVV